ncbi:uncharacterized protein LOC115628195 [Scaptodrosophila lebanonensis]|uniref:Uncharacterized protein LOC115628195 n=1 Tax=Drosophila lebanonensis TaxID=7225 RepID=A0A6J2TY29_DROLE|nr:uncharacterized protein LOC115628195 [Scaptodrosophila lebanonensis]
MQLCGCQYRMGKTDGKKENENVYSRPACLTNVRNASGGVKVQVEVQSPAPKGSTVEQEQHLSNLVSGTVPTCYNKRVETDDRTKTRPHAHFRLQHSTSSIVTRHQLAVASTRSGSQQDAIASSRVRSSPHAVARSRPAICSSAGPAPNLVGQECPVYRLGFHDEQE